MSVLRRHLLLVAVLFFLSTSLYSGSIRNGFIYDDEFTILNNSFISDLNNLPGLLSHKYFALSKEESYRPIVTLTYFIDYAMFELNPWGYHLVNVLFHAFNVVLLYMFAVLLAEQNKAAGEDASSIWIFPFISALIFAFHPVLSEAVEAISFREDLLAAFFYLAAMCSYLLLKRGRGMLLLPISCAFYFLALLSKEMAITLPIIICSYEIVYDRGKKPWNILSEFVTGRNFWFAVVTGIYIYLRFFYYYDAPGGTAAQSSLMERILTVPWIAMGYLKLAVFPVSLSADYEIAYIDSPFSGGFIIPFASLVCLIWAAFNGRERAKELTFGLAIFFLALLPVHNIIPLTNRMAERYIYLPMAGFAVASGYTIWFLIVKNSGRRSRVLLYAVCSMIFVLYGITAVGRHGVWKDPYLLWSDTVRKMPGSSLAHNYLGLEYSERRMWDKALNEYRAAIRLRPDYADAHYNLGITYTNLRLRGIKGNTINDEVNALQTAVALNPDDPDYHFALGYAYEGLGEERKAIEEYKSALTLKPDHFMAVQALEHLLKKHGQGF